MAILSASEFEAVVNHAVISIEKVIQERATADKLEKTRDALVRIGAAARVGERLKALRPSLDAAADTVRAEIPNDDVLLEQLWDLLDYVDYRA